MSFSQVFFPLCCLPSPWENRSLHPASVSTSTFLLSQSGHSVLGIRNDTKTIQHGNLQRSQERSPWSVVTSLRVSLRSGPLLCLFVLLSAVCYLSACSLRNSKKANFRVLHHPAMQRHSVMSESAACGTAWSCYFISWGSECSQIGLCRAELAQLLILYSCRIAP